MHGDAIGGREGYKRAASLLSPQVNVRDWGRFHKAVATHKLRAGDL